MKSHGTAHHPLAGVLSSEPAVPSKQTGKATIEDYRALPDGPPWYQLIDGEFHVSESPSTTHQGVVVELCVSLHAWAKRTGAGRVLVAPCDIYLSEHDVAQPDLLVVLNERRFMLQEDGVHGPPDLVIEILSPSTAALDRGKKRALYAAAGVRELWLVEIEACRITIHRFGGGSGNAVLVLGVGEKLVSPILPGLEIPVAGIFQS